LTQEHQEKLRILEQDTTSKREVLEKDIAQNRKDWQKEQAIFEEAIATYNTQQVKERQREIEEYQYKLEMTRKVNANAYEARKLKVERETQESTKDKEKNWKEREKVLNDNKALFTEYQLKVAAFPAELEEAVKKSREEAIKDTSQKAKVEADLFEKEWESTKQNYELRIKSLEEAIQKQVEQIEGISTQLQTALKQAQDLAMKAFDGNGK